MNSAANSSNNTRTPDSLQASNDALKAEAFQPGYTSSTSEYRLGPIAWSPDEGSVKLTTTLPGEAAIKARIGSVSAELEPTAEAVLATSVVSGNGTTEFGVEAELSVGSKTATGIPTSHGKLEVETAISEGTRARYRVVLPGENQSKEAAFRIDPFNPTTIPPGGSVVMDQQGFAKTELEGSFRHISSQFQQVDAKGGSYAVTRLDERHVRVTLGPNQAVEAYNGIGIKTDLVTAMLGRQDSLSHSKVDTATFDLTNPDAQAAYRHFVSTGEIAHQTPGVSDVATLERIDYTSQTRAKVDTKLGGADLAGNENSGSQVKATYRDGSYSITQDLKYSGNVPLTITKRYDTEGTEIASARSYQLHIDTQRPEYGLLDRVLSGSNKAQEERAMAAMLNTALTGNPNGKGPVNPGDAITLNFNESQMQTLLQDARKTVAASRGGHQLGVMVQDIKGSPEQQSERFAQNIARGLSTDSYKLIDHLHTISEGADGKFDHSYKPIQAQVITDRSAHEPAPTAVTRDNPAQGQTVQAQDGAKPAVHSDTTAPATTATQSPPAPAPTPAPGAPGAPATTIQPASHEHTQVSQLQERLNQLGFRDAEGRELAVDGLHGRDTANAVKALQFQHELEVTGVANPETLRKLDQLDQARQLTAHFGTCGTGVEQLQQQLNRAGIQTPVDGTFDHRLEGALKDYQQQHDLPVSGRPDAPTLGHLHERLQHTNTEPSQASPQILLDDTRHQAHPLFAQGLDCMHRLDAENSRVSDHRSVQMAAALVPAACEQGLKRIDQVLLSEDRNRLFAVQEPGSVHARYAWVETVAASQQPLERSTVQTDQALERQNQQQEQEPQQRQSRPGPTM